MKILQINDEKWKVLSTFFSPPARGRPRHWTDRQILESVLYILHTGCQWRQLPQVFPPHQTVYRRFRQWEGEGVLVGIRDILLQILNESGLDLSVGYVDATFVRAMGGGDHIGKTKIGKGSKVMAIVDGSSRPLAAISTSASPHEISLLQDTLDDLPPNIPLKRLIGDKAYDSDPHDQKLAQREIELIAPHKVNRTKSKTQDGRNLRVIKKRWVVERFFAWMKPARRLLTRFEKKNSVFQAFLDLFSILTIIKDC